MSGRPMTTSRRYIGAAYVEELRSRLSERDWAIIESLARVRCLTGGHLERLHFAGLSARTRARTRRTVLARLARLRVVATLERRIGGVRGGSTGLIFVLDVAGQRLLDQRRAHAAGLPTRPRRPWTPGQLFVRHTLAVSEMYVALTEQARREGFKLVRFNAEPVCWWPNGLGGSLKPDAYLVLDAQTVTDYWWCEVDLATESLTTMKRKLTGYLEFAQRHGLGPDDVLPRVLVTLPHQARLTAIRQLVAHFPHPAASLFHLITHEDAADYMTKILRG
jgi:hypothetical protein